MKTNHSFYLNLAFNLAENNLGKTKINPSVGCIVVKNNSVISSGVTSLNGRPHAEYNALNRNIDFRNSNMYLTLEPCTHYGKTPPCINLIKKKKIKKVYYCFDDPDLRTFQKAKKKLKKKIKKINNTSYKNFFLYDSYFLDKKNKLPLIDAKIAISKDFFTISKKLKWITNKRSRLVGHLIRSKYDTIISTSETINRDNPLLNCRIDGLNNNKPDLVIIDRNLKLKKKLNLFKFTNKRKTYLVTTSKDNKKMSFYRKKKINIVKMDKLQNSNDFNILLKKIYILGKRRILLESGLVFLNKMLNLRLINNLYIFKSGKKLKKIGYNNTKINILKKFKMHKEEKVNLNDDKLFKISIN